MPRHSVSWWARVAVVAVAACGTPVGVVRVDPHAVQRRLTRSVLSSDSFSLVTQNVLYRQDLVAPYASEPEAALAHLHADVVTGRETHEALVALAELSFAHAQDSGKRAYYLAAAVYAYAFLFPGPGAAPAADPLDPRYRLAADLYNRSLSAALTAGNGDVRVGAATYELPFGTLAVRFDESSLVWGSRRLSGFTSVADIDVRGLATRYRWPGIGAPLAAGTTPVDPARGFDDFVQPWAKVSVTAVLRIDDPLGRLADGRMEGTLELYVSTSKPVTIDGRPVPIESESTAALAYTLAESPVWTQEIEGFLSGAGIIDEKSRLGALTPYHPGRIPVVLVHGTASSSGRWAQMVNELSNDARLHGRFAFWLFTYKTGNPILYSAMQLRQSLTDAVARFDPDGTDPALHRMVVIGHSQGGLLAKLTAVDSGSRFWDGASRRPFADVPMKPDTRALLQRVVFVQPLPFVRRVVFIATPQHGSYFAGNWLSHYVARFITLPLDLTHAATDLLRDSDTRALTRFPTAVDNMTPGNRFIHTLADLPLSPAVAGHSIIAVRGDGPADTGDDGIVEYSSAHVDGLESELVVRSAHSCQDNPHTIEEVRRILLHHLEAP